MVEYEGRGRSWEQRESAIVEASALQRCMVDEEQSDLNRTCRVYGRAGMPGVPRPVGDPQMKGDSGRSEVFVQ